MSLAGIDLSIIGPAFVTGLVVLATHVPLGQRVLERGIVFLDLAVAQLAATGAVAVHLLEIENDWAVQGAALTAALLGAWALHRCEQRWPAIQEALIGATFVVAASLVMLLLAGAPHGGEHLQDVLAGQILWVSRDEIAVAAAVSAAVLALWWRLRARLGGGLFYGLFAVAVTVSVQLVGVYLVFASLILPALVARRRGLVAGYVAGAAGYALGLAASALFDLPAGPGTVCGLAVASAVFAIRPVRA
jgi:zinc/manganese transport system permease protein